MSLPLRMRRKIEFTDPPTASRIEGTCWAWTGCLNSKGYGCVGMNGKRQLVHRVAYQLCVGPIPAGLQIDHLCTNKRCCNPNHLEAVTGKVNCERTPHATKLRCVNDHPLVGDNLIIKRRGGLTSRNCRTCQVDSQRRHRMAKRQAASA